jgi:hydroxymethylbilane synthase
VRDWCAALEDADTRTCIDAERAMNRALHGSCHVPVGALARLDGDALTLQGLVGSEHDGRTVRAEARGAAVDADAIGGDVAQRLLDNGAAEFLPPHE